MCVDRHGEFQPSGDFRLNLPPAAAEALRGGQPVAVFVLYTFLYVK